jgi:maltooligosyltrehalose synthase
MHAQCIEDSTIYRFQQLVEQKYVGRTLLSVAFASHFLNKVKGRAAKQPNALTSMDGQTVIPARQFTSHPPTVVP